MDHGQITRVLQASVLLPIICGQDKCGKCFQNLADCPINSSLHGDGRGGEKQAQRTWNQTLQGRVPGSKAGTLACPSIIELEGKAQKQQCWAAWPRGHGVAFRENHFIWLMRIATIPAPKRVLRDQVRELRKHWAGQVVSGGILTASLAFRPRAVEGGA